MYCPKITYCFVADDIQTLNERIKTIAKDFQEEDNGGWFSVNEKNNLVFIDENDNLYLIHLRGHFWRKGEPDFNLVYVTLEKDGISFSFDTDIFDDQL
jgi:hypothetical protein